MVDSFTTEMFGTVPVFHIAKYFDEGCGTQLNKTADEHLCAGRLRMIIDFAGCKVINSPGIGKLLEIVLKVANDYRGQIVLCGLDTLKRKVFLMATIIPTAKEAANVDAALKELSAAA